MQLNLVLNNAQLKKFNSSAGFQMTATQLHSDSPTNARISFSSMKDYKKYEKAFRSGKGLRITEGMYNTTGVHATPSAIPTALSEVDSIEGGSLFKKIRRGVKKGVNKAKKGVVKQANDLDHLAKKEITEKKVKSVAIKTAKAGGKYVAKDLVHKAIAAPITAGLTYGGVPPPMSKAIGDKASAYISKKSGLDNKIDKGIDGLGLHPTKPIRGRGRPRKVNNGANTFADGLDIPDNKLSLVHQKVIKGTGFLNLS